MDMSPDSFMWHCRPQLGSLCNGLSPMSIMWHDQPKNGSFCDCLSPSPLSIIWHSQPQHGLLYDGLSSVSLMDSYTTACLQCILHGTVDLSMACFLMA